METTNKYRILIGLIVILLATNLSMGISFWYHRHNDAKAAASKQGEAEMPAEQRTRFFKEQLELNPDQVYVFRELSRDYNRSARNIAFEMEELRLKMLEELEKEVPEQQQLDSIASEIGNKHAALKRLTMKYYLGMKAVCNTEQQHKLNEIFKSVSKSNENISLPRRGGGYGGPGNGHGPQFVK